MSWLMVAILAFDLAAVRQEPNLEHRSELALDNAGAALAAARDAYQAGDLEHASASLKAAQSYAEKIQMSLLRDAKKLKNAEILIRHTAFRLKELMTGADLDDRPTLEATIQQLNHVQSEMMTQIFRR